MPVGRPPDSVIPSASAAVSLTCVPGSAICDLTFRMVLSTRTLIHTGLQTLNADSAFFSLTFTHHNHFPNICPSQLPCLTPLHSLSPTFCEHSLLDTHHPLPAPLRANALPPLNLPRKIVSFLRHLQYYQMKCDFSYSLKLRSSGCVLGL